MIEFTAIAIATNELIKSKSIINEHGEVYLKHPTKAGQWIKCNPETLTNTIVK